MTYNNIIKQKHYPLTAIIKITLALKQLKLKTFSIIREGIFILSREKIK